LAAYHEDATSSAVGTIDVKQMRQNRNLEHHPIQLSGWCSRIAGSGMSGLTLAP
jgi:hypothetical protein